MRSNKKEVLRKISAVLLTAAMCVTSLSTGALGTVSAAPAQPTPANRDNNDIVYFVDCGDFDVTTVGEGDQLGTHNSVTEQVYGVDEETGYTWGIVDTVSDPLANGNGPEGTVTTDNTWSQENGGWNADSPKTSTNRYTRSQPNATRHLEYAFELESGTYEVQVVLANPWGNMDEPTVTATAEGEDTVTLGERLKADQHENAVAVGKMTVGSEEQGTATKKLTVLIEGAHLSNNHCVNVAYILITSVKEGETEDQGNVRRDMQELSLPESTKTDLTLPVAGKSGTTITWNSDKPGVISNDGQVTRPAAGAPDEEVTFTVTVTSGSASDTKEFTVTVLAPKSKKPADRDDADIVYFVDCGDFDVTSAGEGDQLGTHNSVTEQVYQDDDVTGYEWGIIDTVSTPLKHGNGPAGTVTTDNTWSQENGGWDANSPKTSTNRYTKDQPAAERQMEYAFELERGTYEVQVVLANPWNNMDAPIVVTARVEGEDAVTLGEVDPENMIAIDKVTVSGEEQGTATKKLTLHMEGAHMEGHCVNVAYILIRSIKEGETEDQANVRKDIQDLSLPGSTKMDLTLPTVGSNGSTITWSSDKPAVIANDGKVTRPAADTENETVTLTATAASGQETAAKEFTVTVIAPVSRNMVSRDDDEIIYFVDCGDYDVTTAGEGDQLGTHNSVTEQIYQDDDVTGYEWGIIDTVSTPLKNGAGPGGTVTTDNTWAQEYGLNTNSPKTSTNRYTKNQPNDTRHLEYAFELESGAYEVQVVLANVWNNADDPTVTATVEGEPPVVLAENLKVPNKGNADATGKVQVGSKAGNDTRKLTVRIEGAHKSKDHCVNVAYILIRHAHTLAKVEAVAATCTSKGNSEYWTCDVCEKLFADAEGSVQTTLEEVTTAEIPHSYENVVVNNDGTHSASCKNCGIKKDKEAHHGGTATCISKKKCEVCDAEYGELDTENHVNTEVRNKTNATCTEAGYTGDTYCTDCDTKLANGASIMATGHTPEVRDGKAATCTEAGYTEETYCTVCETVIEASSEIDALGHIQELRDARPATCTEAGHTGKTYCTRCNEILEAGNEIAALGHTPEIRDGKAATCTEAGYTEETYCTVCETVIEAGSEIAALGHSWNAGVVTKKPTVSATGEKTFTCSVCNETKTETIAKLTAPKKGSTLKDTSSKASYQVLTTKTSKGKVTGTVKYKGTTDKSAKTVTIPAKITVDGATYTVTAIADKAFQNDKKITKVVIGSNVTTIGNSAFSGCTKLKTVTIGSNVTTIGTSAFGKCTALTKITIPAKVKKIGKQAFSGCKKLKTVTVKTTKLTKSSVGSKAFQGIYAKATIKVPKSKLKSYKSIFKARGIGKKVKIKK